MSTPRSPAEMLRAAVERAALVVAGPPCAGKSTLARILADRYGMVHLEVDAIRARILPESGNRAEARSVAYRAMHAMAEVVLTLRHGVILDATYGPAEHRAAVEQLALATATALHLIQCRVSPRLAASRFAARGRHHPADDLTPARVRRLARRYPLFDRGVVVDAHQIVDPVELDELLLSRRSLITPTAGWSAASVGLWP